MFDFMTATRVIFGQDALLSSLSVINQYGYSALLVTDKHNQEGNAVGDYLHNQHFRYQHLVVSGEPYITMVEEAAVEARKFGPDMVIAMGGGSALDMGKALAAVIPNKGNVYDYVEVVGRKVPLKSKPLPFIAIPTTAGTGSEVTHKAVLKSGQDRIKVSLRSSDMLADVAIVDPTLTYGMPKELSARGAMTAFTHLMEAYVCSQPNPLTDMICEEGLRRLSRSIIPSCLRDEPQGREDLAVASMLGGMASTNAYLGAAHGLAASLAGKMTAPHSVITARLAPYVMEENIKVAQLEGKLEVLKRYRTMARILTNHNDAHMSDGIAWVKMILEQLRIPALSQFGVCRTSFEQVVDGAMKSVSIKGNPLPLTKARLTFILDHVCSCSENQSLYEGVEREEASYTMLDDRETER
ncbi:iron-containing alcohol dehydrogenase [Vibrio sp. AK197]